MYYPLMIWQLLFTSLVFSLLLSTTHGAAAIGTASQYTGQYGPTQCYGNDQSAFPSDNLFAAAAEPVWDDQSACGRLYDVRCISSSSPGVCIDQIITVKIVDYGGSTPSPPSAPGTTFVLSPTAFAKIANSADSITVEYSLRKPIS